MHRSQFSKNTARIPWRTAVVIAILTALLFESLTVLFFYSYLEKENKVIADQRATILVGEQKNALLVSELLNLNSSVSVVMSGLGNVNQAIETADKHLGSYEHHSGLHSSEIMRLKTMVEMLRSENVALRATGPKTRVVQNPAPHGKRWLTIGIPTVPRKGNPDYLSQTVDAIINQLPTRADDPFYAKVMVVILNNRPKQQHIIFDEVKRRVESSPHHIYFKFEEASVQDSDDVHNPEHDANIPGSKVRRPNTEAPTPARTHRVWPAQVRRQTRAVVALMRASAGLAEHFIFMEDDFLLCPHALRALAYVTAKAYAYFPGHETHELAASIYTPASRPPSLAASRLPSLCDRAPGGEHGPVRRGREEGDGEGTRRATLRD
jgi:hypothetical protein